MPGVSVKHNIKSVQKHLNRIQKEQIPFASATAITWTTMDCQKALIVQAKRVFDNKKDWYNPKRPTGIRSRGANKKTWPFLIGKVYTDAHFAELQEYGGTKKPRRSKNLLVPTKNTAKSMRNARGPEKVLRQKNAFSNKKGIFKMMGGKNSKVAKKIFTRTPSAKIKPVFDFMNTARKIALRKFNYNFHKSLKMALRTAR